MYDFLKKVPLFADLPEADLDRLCQMVDTQRIPAGQQIFAEGDRGDCAYIIESGELEIIKTSGNRPILLAVRRSGDVIGEMALLQDSPRSATVRARSDSVVYRILHEQLDELLNNSATASRVILNTVLGRWRGTESSLRQNEKMAQLGTLTAGVAHELNNPAAAVKSGAGQLDNALSTYAEAYSKIVCLELADHQQAALDELTGRTRLAASQPLNYLDPLERSDRESEFETRLEELGVEQAWELAPTLVSLGFDASSLADYIQQFEPGRLPAIIGWLGATYNIQSLMAEIGQGARRISEIVKALKSYSYLDQAPIQQVDIHEGLDNTLLILRSKLARIKVIREYEQTIPPIQGYGSELNQVWTNLIDNAADALENIATPEIILRTRHSDGWVRVEIQDNGPGIPPEIQARIFDPFFTTKAPGKGTGLGLEISYNIVVDKHRGEIKVFSVPGKTTFRVSLPVNFEKVDTSKPVLTAHTNSDQLMKHILEKSKTIAVVGISKNPDRPAYSVPAYLQSKGYRIIPVNPNLDEILGEKAYPDLLAIPEPVDVVEIFRRSEEAYAIVQQAIQIGAKTIWMQEGILHEQAAELARHAGLEVIMDACMRATHKRLLG